MYTFLAAFKFVGSLVFKLKYDFYDSKHMKKKVEENKEKYKGAQIILKALCEYPQIFDKKLTAEHIL